MSLDFGYCANDCCAKLAMVHGSKGSFCHEHDPSRPLLLIGIHGSLLKRSNPNFEEHSADLIQINAQLVVALARWSATTEVRLVSLQAQTPFKSLLSTVPQLENFELSTTYNLSADDHERPLFVLYELELEPSNSCSPSHLLSKRLRKQNRIIHAKKEWWDYEPVEQVDRFLQALERKSCQITIELQPIRNGRMIHTIHTPEEESVHVTLSNVENIQTISQLKSRLLSLPQLHDHASLAHLRHYPDAIELQVLRGEEGVWDEEEDSDNKWDRLPGNCIIRTMEICSSVTVGFPQTLPTQPRCRYVCDAAATLPLIWLDVDGVINATLGGWELFKKEYPDAKQVTCVADFMERSILYSPTVVAAINRWADLAEIRWHTHWGSRARYHLAPLLGLYDFVACDFTKKQTRLAEVHDPHDLDRPIVWIDDEHVDNEVRTILRSRHLFVEPSHFLSRSDIARVDRFLEK